ncbi:MAG: RDD family protein [Flavobacteriaceae bacterium]|nr:RDD family protein [Flavobacteriaceae bacterium]
MDNFQIETAQNVSIHQNVAHLSTRIGSFLIDMLFIIAYYTVIILIMISLNIDVGAQWALMMLLSLPVFFYNLLFEVLMNGQSPGKRYNKIRVVKLDGSKPTFGSYLLRWMLRLIDISLASGSIALLTILLNGKGQRLGDLAAGTTVISEKKRISLEDTIIADIPIDYKPTFPQVTTLTDTDIQTIKNLYTKAKRSGNHKVVLKLHVKVTELLDIKTDIKPIDFIDIIIKDYNYYTQQM